MATNWAIGRLILERQSEEGWGSRIIDRLAADLRSAFPGTRGFSPRNLKYMRAFAQAWPEWAIVQRFLLELGQGFAFVGEQVRLVIGATNSLPM